MMNTPDIQINNTLVTFTPDLDEQLGKIAALSSKYYGNRRTAENKNSVDSHKSGMKGELAVAKALQEASPLGTVLANGVTEKEAEAHIHWLQQRITDIHRSLDNKSAESKERIRNLNAKIANHKRTISRVRPRGDVELVDTEGSTQVEVKTSTKGFTNRQLTYTKRNQYMKAGMTHYAGPIENRDGTVHVDKLFPLDEVDGRCVHGVTTYRAKNTGMRKSLFEANTAKKDGVRYWRGLTFPQADAHTHTALVTKENKDGWTTHSLN